MAHQAQIDFCIRVRNSMPERFKNTRALDIGSLDVNGNNRYLFDNCEYIGIDIGEGKNVDKVCFGHEYEDENPFGVVVSTECLEHDPFFEKTLNNAVSLLEPGGLLLFTCATTGRAEHGTARANGWAAPLMAQRGLENYYRNLTEADVRAALPVDRCFSKYLFETKGTDLYFYGVVR